MNKLTVYYKTAVSLAQLPFYYLSYKVAEIKYRQHINQSETPKPSVIVEPTFALAQ
ncbi:MAG TPA: hypothetical protein VGD89_01145 [Flavipsychrobacter sp.]